MARRKARLHPPLADQETAMRGRFSPTYVRNHAPRKWTFLRTRPDGKPCEIDVLTRVLRRHHVAVRLAPPLHHRPVDWALYRAAVNWLRREGFVSISDAPGSRCVKSLIRFLTRWRARLQQMTGRKQTPANVYTAAELAGTLIATARAIEWELFMPGSPRGLSTS